LKNIIVIVLFVFLTGCVKVGYKPFGEMSGGYKEKEISQGKYFIEYVAYATTSDKIIERWRRRATELCSNGYKVLEFDPGDSSLKENATVYDRIRNDVYMTGIVECKN